MLREAMLYEKLEDNRAHCFLCAHECDIAESKFGFCGVRQNMKGTLYTYVYGEAIASHVDPIEKKPLYHFLPGSTSYSVATVGCNFRCGFCQNWQISQSSKRDAPDLKGYELKPSEIVREAKLNGCRSISYTYTEPTIFFEYAYDTSKLAKEEGLYNNFVTNGYMTKEAIETIRPYLDACNVDLKSFSDEFYAGTCKARLKPVLDSIKLMSESGIWIEITTLIIPGGNDSREELKEIAGFISGIDKDIPWHISRFHPDYKFTDAEPTPLETMRMAESIGKSAGLRYIYIGNVPGVKDDTVCCGCGNLLIKRRGFQAESVGLRGAECAKCGAEVRGVFDN